MRQQKGGRDVPVITCFVKQHQKINSSLRGKNI